MFGFRVMKKTVQLSLLSLLMISVTGCSTGYWADRGRDAADIMTVTFGNGSGVKARLGPTNIGLLWNEESSGLRNGDFFNITDADKVNLEGQCFVLGFDRAPYGQQRHKAFRSKTRFLLALPEPEEPNTTCSSAYYTQLEAVVGLSITCRIGFNIGEVSDFLLGWTTIDIFNDDLAARTRKEKERLGEWSWTADAAGDAWNVM